MRVLLFLLHIKFYAINPLLCKLYSVNCFEDLYIAEKLGQQVLNRNNCKCFVDNTCDIREQQSPLDNTALSTE